MEGSESHIRTRDKIMRAGVLASWFQKRVLDQHFRPDQVDRWMDQAQAEFEALIPQIPYIGGKENAFTRYLVVPSMLIPVVSVMRDEVVGVRKIGQVMFDMAAVGYRLIPGPLRWWMRRGYFTEKTKPKWRETAKKSQERRYPGDWVCEFVEGDGETFAYGLNMTECGLQKFWRAQELEAFVP